MAHNAQDHHAYLKFPRLIAFNLNGGLSIAATALASQSLVISNHNQRDLAALIPGGRLHISNARTVGFAMTCAAGVASVYTGFMSILITFHIQKVETTRTLRLKEAAMVIMATLLLVAAIAATVVIIPRSAGLSAPGIPQSSLVALIEGSGKSLKYRDTLLFPALICTWLCFGTTLLSFSLASMASRHIAKYGPENTLLGHAVSKEYEQGTVNGSGSVLANENGHHGTMDQKEKPASSVQHQEHA